VVKSAGPGPGLPSLATQEPAVVAALRAQPGTLHYVAEADDDINALGLPDRLSLTGFGGYASWTGYAMITGHWYSGTGEADVNTAFLTDTGTKVGETYTLTSGSGARHLTVRIAGEAFDPRGGHPAIFASTTTLAALDPSLAPGQASRFGPTTAQLSPRWARVAAPGELRVGRAVRQRAVCEPGLPAPAMHAPSPGPS
jgi:hypothetical protein